MTGQKSGGGFREVIIGDGESNKMMYQSNYISTTRYTMINFFPKALALQFKRYANVYFLVMAILMSIPAISPVNPVAAVFPFTFVICLSLLKEALEDRARYLSDIELNASRCTKYEDGG